jgi:hypothetical protein
MPDGAAPLENYARYYGSEGRLVVGVYVSFTVPGRAKYDLPLGQSRWVGTLGNLPRPYDGGCMVVNVVWDTATKAFEEVQCNGLT